MKVQFFEQIDVFMVQIPCARGDERIWIELYQLVLKFLRNAMPSVRLLYDDGRDINLLRYCSGLLGQNLRYETISE